MSRPERPKDKSATYNIFAEQAWAYMDAIEGERDEAVGELRKCVVLMSWLGEQLIVAEAFLSRMGRPDA